MRITTRRASMIALVAIVPIAFAGLAVASLARADDTDGRIPAAVVNDDELVTQTAADGTETQILAGRQLVTELTGPESTGFDWEITNADDAQQMLDDGEIYAIVSVPSDFSASVTSLGGDDPVQAELSIRTDDAHDYLTGSLAQAVGSSMVSAFGTQITETYISGLYAGLGTLGESLGQAADGADELGTGASSLGTGLGELAGGIGSAQAGAGEFASGLATYTSGVGSLSTGLGQLNTGASGLTALGTGVTSYTGGVSQLSAGISAASAALAANPLDPVALGTLQALSGQLAGAAGQGETLASQTSSAISGIQGGISQSATGASRLAAGSGALNAGATSLTSGLGELQAGAIASQDGATQLATGATTLASGLRTGAEQVPAADAADATAEVAAEPITVDVTRANAVTDAATIVSTLFVPIGLWVGAFAVFLLLRPLTRRALASTASDSRLLLGMTRRALLLAIAQVVPLVLLLHTAVGVSWAFLPATLGLSLATAFGFTALHQLLATWLGRAGMVVSIVLLALQLVATGALYPSAVLADGFQAISPWLPLTQAVVGLQAVVAGGSVGTGVLAALGLLALGVLSLLLTLPALRRRRRAQALGLTVAPAV